MVRMTLWLSMLLLACTSAGCAGHLFDYIDNTSYQIKCKHRAKMAWMDARDLYGCVSYPFNFGEGFRDGYLDVCLGNDTGCTPPMPPRRYWSSCYLNCEGKAKSMAWMDGFAHGALAASCDGCAGQCQIATSGGSGGYGTSLKGYQPPVTNSPYGNSPYGNDPYGPGDDGYEPHPTDSNFPNAPPAVREPDGSDLPDVDERLVPEPPTEAGLPLEVWQQPSVPAPIRAAEVYHAPVF